jgi:hypothetical protein
MALEQSRIPDNYVEVNFGEIEVGDKILAQNQETKEIYIGEVTYKETHEDNELGGTIIIILSQPTKYRDAEMPVMLHPGGLYAVNFYKEKRAEGGRRKQSRRPKRSTYRKSKKSKKSKSSRKH